MRTNGVPEEYCPGTRSDFENFEAWARPDPSPGDEFAVAIPNCGRTLARTYAEELRGAVHALAPVLAGRSFAAGTLSISIGFACLDEDCWLTPDSSKNCDADDASTGARLFGVADDALYIAKQQGRNRVSALAPPA